MCVCPIANHCPLYIVNIIAYICNIIIIWKYIITKPKTPPHPNHQHPNHPSAERPRHPPRIYLLSDPSGTSAQNCSRYLPVSTWHPASLSTSHNPSRHHPPPGIMRDNRALSNWPRKLHPTGICSQRCPPGITRTNPSFVKLQIGRGSCTPPVSVLEGALPVSRGLTRALSNCKLAEEAAPHR